MCSATGRADHRYAMRRVKDPVRFARNAALLSGVPAAAVIAVGLSENSILVVGVGFISLWCALAGVMIWARRERRAHEQDKQ